MGDGAAIWAGLYGTLEAAGEGDRRLTESWGFGMIYRTCVNMYILYLYVYIYICIITYDIDNHIYTHMCKL